MVKMGVTTVITSIFRLVLSLFSSALAPRNCENTNKEKVALI